MKTSSDYSPIDELGTATHMLDDLPKRGNYTLIIWVEAPVCIEISDLGRPSFRKGYYAYTGSAMGEGAAGLRHRIARHLRKRKTKHWHIDYLLASEKAKIAAVVACSTSTNEECRITRGIKSMDGAYVPVNGFGASDCRQECRSHLVYCGLDSALGKIVAIHRRIAKKADVVFKILEPNDT